MPSGLCSTFCCCVCAGMSAYVAAGSQVLRYSDLCAWRQGAQRSPLIHFTVSRVPSVSVERTAVNNAFYAILAD
jgi:hypothetical protein